MAFNHHTLKSNAEGLQELAWSRYAPGFIQTPSRSIDFIDLLRNNSYSFILKDGSIIQLMYLFDKHQLKKYRYLYYPCPIQLDESFERYEEGLAEFILERLSSMQIEDVPNRAPIRFDFEAGKSAEYHPTSHVTINDQSCRIPLKSPLGFDDFAKFVMENFYAETWQIAEVRKQIKLENYEVCLSNHDRSRIHLTW